MLLPPNSPKTGAPETLAPQISRLIAPNPSAMTYWGTNTYIVGTNELVIIDPGPDHPDHLASLLAAIGGRSVAGIMVTHSHLDHSPLAPILAQSVGAKVYGFGPSKAGRSARMQALVEVSDIAGGEGVDHNFQPDVLLSDNEVFSWSDGALVALHTPGHFCNHLSFRFNESLFSGDHIMEWTSTLISPPDGDIAQYRASINRLQNNGLTRLFPGHGAPVENPDAKMFELLAHRNAREVQILETLSSTPLPIMEITQKVYHDLPAPLLFAASRNTFAHLIDLYDKNKIRCKNPLNISSCFSIK